MTSGKSVTILGVAIVAGAMAWRLVDDSQRMLQERRSRPDRTPRRERRSSQDGVSSAPWWMPVGFPAWESWRANYGDEYIDRVHDVQDAHRAQDSYDTSPSETSTPDTSPPQ